VLYLYCCSNRDCEKAIPIPAEALRIVMVVNAEKHGRLQLPQLPLGFATKYRGWCAIKRHQTRISPAQLSISV